MKPVSSYSQEPPFWQGLEAQASNVVSQRTPWKPVGQPQVKPDAELEQEPPLTQGEEAQESKVVSHCVPK